MRDQDTFKLLTAWFAMLPLQGAYLLTRTLVGLVLAVLTILLSGLKLFGIIELTWWAALLPIWLPVLLLVIAAVIGAILVWIAFRNG